MDSRAAHVDYGRRRRLEEIIGVVALLGSLYLTISLLSYDRWDRSLFAFSLSATKNYGGVVGAYLSDLLISLLGLASYLIPLFLIVYGVKRILGRERNVMHLAGVMLSLLSLTLLLHLTSRMLSITAEEPGGVLGLTLTSFFVRLLSKPGTFILSIALLFISVILMSPVSPFAFVMRMKRSKKTTEPLPSESHDRSVTIEGPTEQEPESLQQPDRSETLPFERARQYGGYKVPTLDLLRDAAEMPGPSRDELQAAASGLERKLTDFGVSGKIKQAHPGPVVTMYEFEPAPGVKINRIVSLSDDLALALRSPSIRVYPIAGKATIGIEVPNRLRAPVSLKEILSADSFQKGASLLTLGLGKDIFGSPVVADLAKMPHLLVAGATGSGKSVSINAMIISILYKATPDEVKMLLIDPKLLELSAYEDIPHLLSPVITSPKAASEALKKVVFEMERRYRMLAEKGARSIETYNAHAAVSERLPYIVVFIDELADLMFTAPTDVENAIARLAQMARASGIHLILATQRPSVDVITGLIKANFPARISFQVTSKIDSRTILDAQGAEQLLGMGDMLLMVPGVRTVRIHGAYVSDKEVKAVTEFIKGQRTPDYTSFEGLVVPEEKSSDEGAGERDEMYQRIIEFAESVGEVSISSIQRRFKIGYNRAARIMELLEEDGLVGPPKGAGKPRDFLKRRQQ